MVYSIKSFTEVQEYSVGILTVFLVQYKIIIVLVFNLLAPFFEMVGQLVTRFGDHHFNSVNHLNPSV